MGIRFILGWPCLAASLLSLLLVPGPSKAANIFGSLVVGASGEDLGAAANAGAVNVIKGSASGLTGAGSAIWYQGLSGIQETPEASDAFGGAAASGDFNNDGFPDLAIGASGEDIGAVANAGAVHVMYGSAAGLTTVGNRIWYQGLEGLEGLLEADDNFGVSLAAGDFNGDGFADLAVGVPRESLGGMLEAGVVQVIYGSAAGLTVANAKMWYQGLEGIQGVLEAEDRFGSSLAAADFNNDGFADLAVGADAEAILASGSAGAVNVIYGSAAGLTGAGNKMWHQGLEGIEGTLEQDDRFGSSLTAGDFDNDGYADLAVGVPYETIGTANSAGAVNILYGSAAGLASTGNKIWYQGLEGVAGVPEPLDRFGTSLAAGDFNHDGFADLATGVIGEGVSGQFNAGAVNILYGAAAGLASAGNKMWYQGLEGIEGTLEANDYLGGSLAAGDFNNDRFADLAIGVPVEGIGSFASAGAVNVIYGSVGGLTGAGNAFWYQGLQGIQGTLEADDRFGASLVFLPPSHAPFPWPMFLPALNGGAN